MVTGRGAIPCDRMECHKSAGIHTWVLLDPLFGLNCCFNEKALLLLLYLGTAQCLSLGAGEAAKVTTDS